MTDINDWHEALDDLPKYLDEEDCCSCKHDEYCLGGCGWDQVSEYTYERMEETN